MRFWLASYKFLFIHCHLGQSTEPETMWLHADTPAPAHEGSWHSQPRQEGKGSLALATQGSPPRSATLIKYLSDTQTGEVSHLPLPDPTFLFHCRSTWSCPHYPSSSPAFISLIFTQKVGNCSSQIGLARMKTGDGSTTPTFDKWVTCYVELLCFEQLHP